MTRVLASQFFTEEQLTVLVSLCYQDENFLSANGVL